MNQSLGEKLSAAAESSNSLRQWRARLSLKFAAREQHTRLAHCEHDGPLRVQRLFHPDQDGTAHCYLLHPPGGVVLGDELHIDAQVASGSALLTTPSAGRFYGVGDFRESQLQKVRLHAAPGTRLAWLPQETILFPGANARLSSEIDLEGDARLAFWDIVVLGRPAAGERFGHGALRQLLQLRRDGRLLLDERVALQADDRFVHSAMGLRGASTVGTCILSLDDESGGLDALCASWLTAVNGAGGEGDFAVSQRGSLLLARYLGEDAARCRHGFSTLWRTAEQQLRQRSPSEPRIWHT